MKPECIECLIICNREIEFVYKGTSYSITYQRDENGSFISVCEFYKRPINVKTVAEVLDLKIGKRTLQDIFADLPDSAFTIY